MDLRFVHRFIFLIWKLLSTRQKDLPGVRTAAYLFSLSLAVCFIPFRPRGSRLFPKINYLVLRNLANLELALLADQLVYLVIDVPACLNPLVST
jgi:hypothetical protein